MKSRFHLQCLAWLNAFILNNRHYSEMRCYCLAIVSDTNIPASMTPLVTVYSEKPDDLARDPLQQEQVIGCPLPQIFELEDGDVQSFRIVEIRLFGLASSQARHGAVEPCIRGQIL